MIYIIITSYKEPRATVHAVKAFLHQKNLEEKMQIVVVDPFPEVKDYLKKEIKDKRVSFFLDPGQGKNYALTLVFEKYFSRNANDIIILSDGDVYVSENAVAEILKKFSDKNVGCVTGRPVSLNPENTRYGFWAKVLYAAIHEVRKKLDERHEFFQCSGYLFALRNSLVTDIPFEVPEDAIIPYLVWKKGYRVAYAEHAEVFVTYPTNGKDWINQRVRTIKAHENIHTFAPDMPRTKSFVNEIKKGLLFSLKQPKSIKEFAWLFYLYIARLYIYGKSFWEMKRKKGFNPEWRETEIKSTNPFEE